MLIRSLVQQLPAEHSAYFAVQGGGSSNGSASNALYATEVDLLGNTNLVANLHSSFNIYYMLSTNDPFNAYLQDNTYALQGGGFLMPAIPEPSSLMLIAGAVLLLCRCNWRPKKS